MAAIDRYQDNLSNPVAPGTGENFNPSWLPSTAILGVMAGIDPQQIHDDIRRVTPAGNRPVPDKEISRSINNALRAWGTGTFTPRPQPKPIINNGKDTRQQIINQSQTSDEADLYELSHIRLDYEPKDDAIHFLPVLFEPGDLLFIGDRLEAGIIESAVITTEADLWEDSPVRLTGEPAADAVLLMENRYDGNDLLWTADRHEPGTPSTIKPVCEWIMLITAGKIKLPPFFIINPLTGLPAPKKSGDGITYRGDDNVKRFRYCMAEFDNLSREDQIKFWSACKLPIRALIDSGNKSIHAIIDVQKLANVQNLSDWATHIKGRLYNQILVPMGVDAACSNPSRLSRLPGHYREEKKSFQKLLWLSPKED